MGMRRVTMTPDSLRNAFRTTAADRGMRPSSDGLPLRGRSLRSAAVLVPLVARSDMTVLLTRRADHLQHHPGQISFPGGRVEPSDSSPVEAALRETQEEVGLGASCIELLGELPEYLTGTGFRITPVVGLVHPPFELKVDPSEVAEAFEVPLQFLLDPANHHLQSLEHEGNMRYFHAMPYEERYIWGATAAMLKSLYEFLGSK